MNDLAAPFVQEVVASWLCSFMGSCSLPECQVLSAQEFLVALVKRPSNAFVDSDSLKELSPGFLAAKRRADGSEWFAVHLADMGTTTLGAC